MEPRLLACLVAAAGLAVLGLPALWRARHSTRPAILYTCAAYMLLLHAVWITGLLTSHYMENAFATTVLLTFPWSTLATVNLTMAGFATLHDVLLNYARFVLGFGGMQCLLLTLFVWELKLERRGHRGMGRVAAARESAHRPTGQEAPLRHR